MKKILTSFLLLFILTQSNIFSQKIDYKNLSSTELLSILASDSLQGRYPGSKGMEKANQFVEQYLQKNGIQPFFNNTYRDTVLSIDSFSYNIVGIIPAKQKTTEYILLGAHMDHLGAVSGIKDSVYNGANDNATGVVALLKIAQRLQNANLNKNIIIAIFTGEELGLLGSENLALRLKSKKISLQYVINFEMLGIPLTSNKQKLYITGYDYSDFATITNTLISEEFIIKEDVDEIYDLFRRSDNYPFYEEFKIPSHTIIAYDFKNFPYYHELDDDISHIDLQYFESIVLKLSDVVVKLTESNVKISLTTKSE